MAAMLVCKDSTMRPSPARTVVVVFLRVATSPEKCIPSSWTTRTGPRGFIVLFHDACSIKVWIVVIVTTNTMYRVCFRSLKKTRNDTEDTIFLRLGCLIQARARNFFKLFAWHEANIVFQLFNIQIRHFDLFGLWLDARFYVCELSFLGSSVSLFIRHGSVALAKDCWRERREDGNGSRSPISKSQIETDNRQTVIKST